MDFSRLCLAVGSFLLANWTFSAQMDAARAMLDGLVREARRRPPAKVILDTDMVSDYDDAGALAVLHRLADWGVCEILGVVSSTRHNRSVAAIEIINAYYRRPEIPVGCTRGAGVDYVPSFESRAVHDKYEWLARNYARFVTHANSSDAPDAVRLYRQILARAPDASVTVCTIGFLTNLRLLLESKGDEVSPLGGRELVARKVVRLYAMACRDEGKGRGKEYNSRVDAASSRVVLEQWPTPILFSDFDYGVAIHTGRRLAEAPLAPGTNPVADLYRHCLHPKASAPSGEPWRGEHDSRLGRASWDQTAVLAAVFGAEAFASVERGRYRMVGEDGTDEWVPDAHSTSGRLVERVPKRTVAGMIDELMMPPAR